MAKVSKRLESNVEGNFYVDSTCIDCDTCRQLAPMTFIEHGEFSTVFHQPEFPQEELASYQALMACPVGSIGTVKKNHSMFIKALNSFPLKVEEGVYYVGFNSEKSYGANSYFVHHPDGNWLIDSPRYLTRLVRTFEAKGGIRYIFLTHEDDVAEAARYANSFDATRIIHRADSHAMTDAEWIIDGEHAVQVGTEFLCIPVPGHTAGSMALLFKNRVLFSGDHLWWKPDHLELGTPETLVWDQAQLERSVKKLLKYPFEWVLPGHGHRISLDSHDMKEALHQLIRCRWHFQPDAANT